MPFSATRRGKFSGVSPFSMAAFVSLKEKRLRTTFSTMNFGRGMGVGVVGVRGYRWGKIRDREV
jgi:hypothetical protein